MYDDCNDMHSTCNDTFFPHLHFAGKPEKSFVLTYRAPLHRVSYAERQQQSSEYVLGPCTHTNTHTNPHTNNTNNNNTKKPSATTHKFLAILVRIFGKNALSQFDHSTGRWFYGYFSFLKIVKTMAVQRWGVCNQKYENSFPNAITTKYQKYQYISPFIPCLAAYRSMSGGPRAPVVPFHSISVYILFSLLIFVCSLFTCVFVCAFALCFLFSL